MKNIQNKLVVFLFIVLAFPQPGSSQDSFANDLSFEIKRIYPPISITKEKLNEAKTLTDLSNNPNDLNLYYKSSWIREYISVEVLTIHKGRTRKAMSKNDTLSQEQKDNINLADLGTDITVKVQYLPENTLTHNDPKELDFSFSVDPENEAKYPGGEQQLKQYLKEKAIDRIPDGSFKNYDFTAIQFTISEEGEIINAQVFESAYQSYNNEQINKLLLETIRHMPCWKPAEFANGTKVKQDFVLTVGNMENCVINLLNIRRE